MVETNRKSFATLGDVADIIGGELKGDPDEAVIDISHDSRQITQGWLFVAIKGLTIDGHRFIEDVQRRGAIGVISELDCPEDFQGHWIKVSNTRRALALAADIIQGQPSKNLSLIGITGTNGKTTTTYLTYSLAEAANAKSAMLTTVEYRIGEKSEPAIRTTPESPDTNRFLRQAIDAGCKVAVMESSSQALDLNRCYGLAYEIAVFSNLTRDHLDYHLTMENYFAAKKKLFDGSLGLAPKYSVINIDDSWGARLANELRSNNQDVVTYAIDTKANFYAKDINVSLLSGTSFELITPFGTRSVVSPLVGKPHVYNILAAIAATTTLGLDLELILKGIETCIGAPGRFERVPHDGDFAIVVDYAHSDDALLNTLRTAKSLTKGRIITVFGCGGDRDKSKRAPMGEVAGENSDLVILTSDNPRTEDPFVILSDAEIGLKKTDCPFLMIPDRREAIFAAIQKAKTDDVVIIAGKGHETYQIIGNDKFHFDDREVALDAIEDRKTLLH